MSKVAKRTFSLPAEQAAYIDDKVADGAYASASEVVLAGLRALQKCDAAFERWLRDEVVPAYDAMKANPKQDCPRARSSPWRAPDTQSARPVAKA